jgi:hypothetical protein
MKGRTTLLIIRNVRLNDVNLHGKNVVTNNLNHANYYFLSEC